MRAIWFIILRQMKNRFKRIFTKPASAIITILACLFFLIGPIFSLLFAKKGLTDFTMMEVIIAGLQLFMGVILINTFLSQQSGLYTLADANLLFTAPLKRNKVLAYAIIQTGPGSLFTAVFMTFYYPFIFGSAMSPLKFLGAILIMTLLFACIYLSYYYIYLQDIRYPGLKKRLQKIFLVLIIIAAAIFTGILINNGLRFSETAAKFFINPLYNAIPIFGWAKWGIITVIQGQYLTGFIPAVVFLFASAAMLAYALYSCDIDFYEQALQDSFRVQEVLDSVKSGKYDANKAIVKKVKQAKVKFYSGAASIFSRQLLEIKKSGPLITYRELLSGVIYIAIAKIVGLDFNFVIIMLVFSLMSTSAADSWNAEFKRPYIFLIPESSFRKVLYSVLPGIFKSVAIGFITIVAASLLFKITPEKTIGYLVIFVSYVILFVFSGVFTYRILGVQTNAASLMFLRMLFLLLAAIPSSILIVLLSVIFKGSTSLALTAAATAAVNIAESLLLALMSRRLFEQSELMN